MSRLSVLTQHGLLLPTNILLVSNTLFPFSTPQTGAIESSSSLFLKMLDPRFLGSTVLGFLIIVFLLSLFSYFFIWKACLCSSPAPAPS